MNIPHMLIGISGGTGSGKTTISKKIISKLNKDDITLIQLDSYYKNINHLSYDKRSETNFDHPNALDFDLLKKHMRKISNGSMIKLPIYNFKTHKRSKKTKNIFPTKIIILEGIHSLFDQSIRSLMNIKIYIDADDDFRIIRRLKRDINSRNRSFDSVINQYYSTVRPMHIKFVEPVKKFADIIITNNNVNNVSINNIDLTILSMLKKGN